MTYIIVSNGPSAGAANLANELRILGFSTKRKIIGRDHLNDVRPRDYVINWGSSGDALATFPRVSNSPDAVGISSNKLNFFRKMSENPAIGPRIPKFVTTKEDATRLHAAGYTIVARVLLQGHSGLGIHIISPEQDPLDIPDARLYTVYVKKAAEYRLHFGPQGVFDVQRKALANGFENPNHQIRTHGNGFRYVRTGVEESVPEDVRDQAEKARILSGLNHGAVDVIYNRRQDQAYVLEINTAPGIEGTTARKYAEMIGGCFQ